MSPRTKPPPTGRTRSPAPPQARAVAPKRHQAGVDWSGRELAGARLVDFNLTGAKLAGADLRGADLTGACLAGADLTEADLTEANLKGADLTGARLVKANLTRARLHGATLEYAELGAAQLLEADLTHASAHHVKADAIDLTRARLQGCNLSRSSLKDAKLFGARVAGAHFERTLLNGAHMAGIRGYETANWKNVDIRNVDTHGTYLARRFMADQNYLYEFRARSRKHELVYWLWWLTSDCGRSIGRWALLTFFLVVVFAKAYTFCSISYGAHETWFSPFYYSVVTLTSLGYGDVVPKTPSGQALAMVEVTVGYVMLGGLMSIFSTKMARRAD